MKEKNKVITIAIISIIILAIAIPVYQNTDSPIALIFAVIGMLGLMFAAAGGMISG